MAAEPGFYHVLPWLEWSHLHRRARMVNELAPRILQNSGSTRLHVCNGEVGGTSPGDANKILRKPLEERPWTTSTDARQEEPCSLQKRRALDERHLWGPAPEDHEVLGLPRTFRSSSEVRRTRLLTGIRHPRDSRLVSTNCTTANSWELQLGTTGVCPLA